MKRVKNLIKLAFVTLLMGATLISCEKETKDSSQSFLVDEVTVATIKASSEKIVIDLSELPETSVLTLESEYPESYASLAYKVVEVGYEVTIRKTEGSTAGEAVDVYFSTNGRLLQVSSDTVVSDTSSIAIKYRMSKKECFSLVYPVNYVMPDSSVLTIADSESWSTIKNWYKENGKTKKRPKLVLPVTIIFEDAEEMLITNYDDLKTARKLCKAIKADQRENDTLLYKQKCFDVIYPVDLSMPDGTLITVNDTSGIEDIKAWYEANPDSTTKPQLVFPIEVQLSTNDSIVTITSSEEMKELRSTCKKPRKKGRSEKGSNKGFSQLVYPVSYQMPDSSVIELSTSEDKSLIKEWYEINPEVSDKPSLIYPIEVLLSSDSIVTINSKDELQSILKEGKKDKNKKKKTQ